MDRDRRRRFGQNFLADEIAREIAADLPVSPGEAILEIGPGHGSLTQYLIGRCRHLTAVEIDPQCADLIRRKFPEENVQVCCTDFLTYDLEAYLASFPDSWVVGNLPYNAATAILTRLLAHLHKLRGIMAMTQLEVAQRICASPGSKAYGSLSVLTAAHAQALILRRIGPEHFTPRPKVQSAIILLLPKPQLLDIPSGFFEFVQQCFHHKRKRLTNSLQSFLNKETVRQAILALGKTQDCRVEELTLSDFIFLFQKLHLYYP